MDLAEILRILMESGDVTDIQGVSREGPFTILYVDGTRDTNVTLAELQALAAPFQTTPERPGGPGLEVAPLAQPGDLGIETAEEGTYEFGNFMGLGKGLEGFEPTSQKPDWWEKKP